ncbi:CYTH domain-containing protein [Alloalcanivorax gelatiniphagus]|uniref:CYTH domain-containing protein n=1 Tax=Alloalcanivorax gelatiniphagus TaxID=1194167 RepID=A0ABY2XN41_9GAMM|nr:CYTH domain-containing protein [Alloalcanivorax gelatiniphagus]TMW12867.1 CYTH domain-containing protein [Alloalcanivorax gelatiniphagus]|tara:strand:- start:14648 stop:15115 length:468 start_codon:yes stop_codon:yes gene_type:complete
MGLEIERKFRVTGTDFLAGRHGERLVQGYLSHDQHATVRVRIQGDRAWLTLKGETRGARRSEFEYPIPVDDALAILAEMCAEGVIDKTRYRLPAGDGLEWEVDVFHGDNDGLVVAEIELSHEDQPIPRPDWLAEEVTDDPRYYNSALSRRPYGRW